MNPLAIAIRGRFHELSLSLTSAEVVVRRTSGEGTSLGGRMAGAGEYQGGTSSEKRVARAVEHIGDYWIPVNPALLDTIKTNLEENVYQDDLTSLLQDVKSDFSLFTFCLRKLYQMLADEGLEIPVTMNPVEVLEWGGIDRLESILSVQSIEVSVHSLQGGNDLQLSRFQETLISASTSEALSESYSIDKDTAYSAAVLRQLGVTLIAWNYPGLYEEVVRSLEEGDVLDVKLAGRLGFSPTLLAIRVMESWGMTQEATTNLGLVDDSFQAEETLGHAMTDTLAELCRVGEALARAHRPDIYPSAKDDWEVANKEVERHLGSQGMQMIQEKVTESAEAYLSFMPDIFDFGLVEQYSFSVSESLDEEQYGNPFLQHCSPVVSRGLFSLYQQIDQGATVKSNLRAFTDQAVPLGQFTGGCVYTADPGLMMLMPQLVFGKTVLREVTEIDYSIVLSNADMVAVAFQSVDPIVEYGMSSEGELVTAISGMFGHSQRIGVLYLEIPDAVTDFVRDDKVIHFQALRHVLADCLRLT